LENSILHGSPLPDELIEYRYREKFHLSNAEMLEEPLEKFYVNLEIMDIEAFKENQEINKNG